MKWIDPKHSKRRVRSAGEMLIDPSCTELHRDQAMEILSNWRAAHAYPMHAMLIFLRTRSAEIDDRAIVVQRLKRTPSILHKLERFPGMKLHRMQDIGGCRAVVQTTSQAEKLSTEIQHSRTRHQLHKIDNYIDCPKESGYRGIHLIYKYNGAKKQYQDFFVELQLRSRIQHAWATAVEIVDTFTSQALKASHGHQDWLDFFQFVSAEFAKLERRPVGSHIGGIDTRTEVLRLERKLNAMNRLSAFAITTQHIERQKEKKSDYFLLRLEGDPQTISVTRYPAGRIELATQEYLRLERRAQSEELFDAVLVSASSLHALKTAYPNYFADSKQFVRYLGKVVAGVAR
jgi:RelA/SpoT family protein